LPRFARNYEAVRDGIEVFLRARVDGENDRDFLSDFFDPAEYKLEFFSVVDIGRTVQGEQCEVFGSQI